MPGFRATVVVRNPTDCPVADASATTDEPITAVAQTRASPEGTVVEEFSVARAAPGAVESGTAADLTPIQAGERETVYRFERDATADCACTVVERTGTPVSSVRSQNGSLLLTFRTFELEEVADIVDELRERFDGVHVDELTRDGEEVSTDPVVVDRELLTARQREILETAYEMGYFQYPKGANATDVAAELEIARSTFTEHLAAAQTKLLNELLKSNGR